MKHLFVVSVLLVLCGVSLAVAAQSAGAGQGARAPGQTAAPRASNETPAPIAGVAILMGCVTSGSLQPVEEPFILEPSAPFVLEDVVTMEHVFARSDYRVTGINLTPWLGLRVKVEGTVTPASARGSGPAALPQIKATRVTSIWGTCASPPAWIPTPATLAPGV